jgi:serine/threonine protein kinase
MERSADQWGRAKDRYEGALECDPKYRAAPPQRNGTDDTASEEVRRQLWEHEESSLSTVPFTDFRRPVNPPGNRFAPGEVLAERFRIVGFIAAGGMGEVYEAEDLTLKENLAIKTIRPEFLQQDQALARFIREVQLARRVTHPNVCRVFDLFWHKRLEGTGESAIVFVSMELLKGETLSQRIRRAGRFTAEEALPLINQIASGLEAAHRAGVVHRDLKPGNVILVPEREENQIRAVVTDFGLALPSGVEANKSVDLVAIPGDFGTPAYMAPEQIEGKEVTKLADIYALGLIIYEMVTGTHAYPADTPLASAVKRLFHSIESPNRFAPQLGAHWEQAIIGCLKRDPCARFHSATDVTRALSVQAPDAAIPPQAGAYPALGQLHFGAAPGVQHLPESWSSTSSTNAVLQFTMKDALLAVDADRLIRGQENHAVRVRPGGDGITVQDPKPPRYLTRSIEEITPRGQSVQDHIWILCCVLRSLVRHIWSALRDRH